MHSLLEILEIDTVGSTGTLQRALVLRDEVWSGYL